MDEQVPPPPGTVPPPPGFPRPTYQQPPPDPVQVRVKVDWAKVIGAAVALFLVFSLISGIEGDQRAKQRRADQMNADTRALIRDGQRQYPDNPSLRWYGDVLEGQ